MSPAHHLGEIVLLLAAAVCIVALFRHLRFSPILGYIAAGIVIGPHGLGLIRDMQSTQVIAELGVIFLLFLIGLELSFERLARLRGQVLGFGVAQVLLTSLVIGAGMRLLGQPLEAAIIVGGGLALSSTAVVMELLSESNEKATQVGRLSIKTLILQDLAVIPLLVLVPLLAGEGSVLGALGEAGIKAVLGLAAIMLLGRRLLRPLFRMMAEYRHTELFTATTLLVVLGMAYMSTLAGISPALGAFMGGLLVSETEFRPQVEADILPFKALLLGLFFMTVGMGIDLSIIREQPITVLALMLSLIAVKASLMLALSKLFAIPVATGTHAALLLAQGGEFTFVLFMLAENQGILSTHLSQMLLAAVVLSMTATPLLHALGKALARRSERGSAIHHHLPSRDAMELEGHIIIAGFGRVGRTVAELLDTEHIPYVALDMDASAVGAARAQGKRVYYGDAARAVVLKTMGIGRAQAVIVTHADTQASLHIIQMVRSLGSRIPIIVRARNLEQVQQLEQAGANLAVAEMFETSLQLGGALLKEIGVPDPEVSRVLAAFRAEDYALTRRAETETAAPAQA